MSSIYIYSIYPHPIMTSAPENMFQNADSVYEHDAHYKYSFYNGEYVTTYIIYGTWTRITDGSFVFVRSHTTTTTEPTVTHK